MSALTTAGGNLLINGKFLRGLWPRLADVENCVLPCPVWAQTFAADRWSVRFAASTGGPVAQTRSDDVPPGSVVEHSLEIQGGAGVTQMVCIGQSIEAEEAPHYRQPLRFTAWICLEHPTLTVSEMTLAMSNPQTADLFDASVETVTRTVPKILPVNRWERVEFTIDATALRATGLRVELEFSPSFLSHPAARIRLADATLCRASSTILEERSAAVEMLLARRFFQRHDGTTTNAVARMLVGNAHELHFQFSFPEMRAFPTCTIAQDNADLGVFSHHGLPQSGFIYDVTSTSRGSAVIRATKLQHGLSDGYLAFRGYRGSILLDAEL